MEKTNHAEVPKEIALFRHSLLNLKLARSMGLDVMPAYICMTGSDAVWSALTDLLAELSEETGSYCPFAFPDYSFNATAVRNMQFLLKEQSNHVD